MLLPALLALREPNAWWAPVAGLVLAGAFLGLGIRAAEPTPDRPAPSTLLYAYDHGDPEALWITDRSDAEADAEARAWVTDRVSADFTGPTSLESFGFRRGARPTAPAPVVDVQPPTVARVSDVVVDGVRRMELAVRSEVGAELMVFLFPQDGFGRVTAVNGHAVPTEDRPLRVEHWGTPEGSVLLTMELPPQAEPDFTVVEHLLRPEEILGSGFFQRPPHLAPDITELSDRAILRTPLDVVEVREEPFFEILPSPGMPAEAVPDTTGALPDTTGATQEPGSPEGRDG